MSGFARPCRACGRRAAPGEALCPACRASGGRRPSSCRVCGARTGGGPYCRQHSSEIDRVRRQPWRSGYDDPLYRAGRLERFEQAGRRCEDCGAELEGRPWECDHLVALRDGGTNITGNLRVRCPDCHQRKTAADRRRRKSERTP